jgi:alanine dehydrogenase
MDMLIGVPKEVKIHEYRVGLTPGSVHELIKAGNSVLVETNAGIGIGCSDADYVGVGAEIADSAEDVFAKAEMIVKVKEPQIFECERLREGQVLFTYLHLAPDPEQASALMKSGATAIAYETVTDAAGRLPLLVPMSEVAGRMSIQVGARCLEKEAGGSGVLLGGVPGVKPANVTVIGGGVAGTSAARMAFGLGARVTIIDRSLERLRQLDDLYGDKLSTRYSTSGTIAECVAASDLVVGSVLIPGAAAPKLVTREMIGTMQAGSAVVDIAIDQGGCFETSRPTSHAEPTYVVDDILHYCVTNMPGAVARTSAYALNNATLPFALALASKGAEKAMADDPHLANGLNVYHGEIAHEAVAVDLGHAFRPAKFAA